MKNFKKTKVYHIGEIDFSKKEGNSYEGSGLSVSEYPNEWAIIIGSGSDVRSLEKKVGGLFLDYYSLTTDDTAHILQWSKSVGLLEDAEVYSYRFFDEYENECKMTFDTFNKALEEADGEEDDVLVEQSFKGTQTLLDKSKWDRPLIGDFAKEMAVIIYAEEVLGLDGVWWEEELDVYNYSAPRGVIFNNKITEWTIS